MTTPDAPTPTAGVAPARWVNCPSCATPTRYAPDNPHRPFCSARCRGVDLGAWASESYRVDAPTPPDPALD